MFLWVLWAPLASSLNPRKGSWEPPTYSPWVGSPGKSLGFPLVSPVCVVGEGCAVKGQSCRTEHLTHGIWRYLQVNNVRTELNYRTPSWCQRIAWMCGEKKPHYQNHTFKGQMPSSPKNVVVGRKTCYPKCSWHMDYFKLKRPKARKTEEETLTFPLTA